ncbi:MAG TPA: MBL fold metallo-hydrolase [Actinomycetota bacterium]
MELTVLGSDGTWPRADGAASGYIVSHDGFVVWQDMGTGTMAHLQRHLGLLDVDAVIVSHVHADHFVDLFPYFYARRYGAATPAPSIPLVVPTGTEERIRCMLSQAGWEEFPDSFQLHEIEPGAGLELGPFRVSTARMAHPVPTLGVRYEADGVALAYSADTGPTDELVDLARGVDLLVAEATWLEDGKDYPPDLHMTAKEAGEQAAKADAGRLMLAHIQPIFDPDHSREKASEAFEGAVDVARPDVRWEAGA